MIRAYYTTKIVPISSGPDNFSIDLWTNIRSCRLMVHTLNVALDEYETLVYTPHYHDTLIRSWERDDISFGEISQFTSDILGMCDLLIVDGDPGKSSEVKFDIDIALEYDLDICYVNQHSKVEDKLNEILNLVKDINL